MKNRNTMLALAMCMATAGAPVAANAGIIYTEANPWPEWTPMYWMHEMLKVMEEDGRFIDSTKLAALREYYLGDHNRYARDPYRDDYRREMLDQYYRRSRLDRLRRDPYLRSSYRDSAAANPYARRSYDRARVDPYSRSPDYDRYGSSYDRSTYRPSPYGRTDYDPYLLPYARGRYGYGRYGSGYARGAYGYDPYRSPYGRVAYQPAPYGRSGYGYYGGYNNAYYPGYNRGYGQWNRRAAPASRYSRNRKTRSSRWDINQILGNSTSSSPLSGINPMQSWGASNSFNPMNSWNPTQQFNPMNSLNPAQAWNPGNAFNPLNSMNPLGGSSSWMPSTGGNGLSLPWGGSGSKGGSSFNPGSFFQKTSYLSR